MASKDDAIVGLTRHCHNCRLDEERLSEVFNFPSRSRQDRNTRDDLGHAQLNVAGDHRPFYASTTNDIHNIVNIVTTSDFCKDHEYH